MRKVPLPGRGVTNRDKHWLGILGQVGLHRAGWGQVVLLPLQEWGCLVSPSLSRRLASGAVFFMAFFPHGHIPAQHWGCVGGSCSRDTSLGLRAPLSARQAASPALHTVQASFIIPKGLLKKKKKKGEGTGEEKDSVC